MTDNTQSSIVEAVFAAAIAQSSASRFFLHDDQPVIVNVEGVDRG